MIHLLPLGCHVAFTASASALHLYCCVNLCVKVSSSERTSQLSGKNFACGTGGREGGIIIRKHFVIRRQNTKNAMHDDR